MVKVHWFENLKKVIEKKTHPVLPVEISPRNEIQEKFWNNFKIKWKIK